MLSRRGLRIKAMQTHYVFAQSDGMQVPAAVQQLNQSIHNSYAAYLYCLHFISKLAMQQDLEAHIKKNKYLPSTDDLNFIPKFFNNQIIQFLLNNTYFQSRYRREKMQIDDEDEIEKLIYTQLKEFSPFHKYMESENGDEKKILEEIFRNFLLKNEYFDEHMENVIATWADDEFIVQGLMDEFFRAKIYSNNNEVHLFDFSITEEEKKFAEELVRLSIEHSEEFDNMIESKLHNWELDRVSLIDKILMKMALTEFMHMPTIPVKVTINEYLDISKTYSTPRSREFINGVLDKIMNELKASGTIIKSGRGLIE